MSDSKPPFVVGLGQVGMEIVGQIGRYPDHDMPVEFDQISIQVGGNAAVAVGTAAALGCSARLACRLADDFVGGFVLEALREAGIETRGHLDRDRQLSRLAITTFSRDHSRRQTLFTPGDVGELTADEFDIPSLLADASAVIVDGYYADAQVRLAEAARMADVPVIFDGSSLREGVGTLAALSDVLICSERLAAELAPRDELEDCLVEIQRLGPRAVIITLGQKGSVGLHGDQMVVQPAYDAAVRDPTGAGAVYHGAFTSALLNRLPFAQCMEFASAAAALSCRRHGSWAGIPERDEVVRLVRAAA